MNLLCLHCNNSFERRVRKGAMIDFCSLKCKTLYNGGEEKICKTCRVTFTIPKWKVERGEGIFCSKKCESTFRKSHLPNGKEINGRWHISTICSFCEKEKFTELHAARKFDKHFCNHSCKAKYLHQNKMLKLNTRSKSEDILVNLIKSRFPNLKLILNDRSLLKGLEIDIYIPDEKLAIELNGPLHYFPIFGDDKLSKIKNKDVLKQQMIQELGLRLVTIDTSYQTSKLKIDKIINDAYNQIILPILS